MAGFATPLTVSGDYNAELLRTLVSALECIMNVSATNEERQAAHKICEEFKENSPDCVQCGFVLAQKENPPVVRHFGLQSIEHFIKYRWHQVNDEQKSFLKTSSLELIHQGTKDILLEEQHVKDAVSRIAVELIKREWPQMWEDLFTQFTSLCEYGETQTELVLLVLLRLSEDVVRFQTVPQQRRKDLSLALTKAMGSIFSFFMFILNKYLEKYRNEMNSNQEREKACRICLSVLETLTGFVEWVAITHITDTGMLPMICTLLLDQKLCLIASECLLLTVGRKGKVQDRQPLMVLFSREAMTVLLQAANNATEHITESTNFIFLKRLCEILMETGKQLCALWGNSEEQGQPDNFEMYLKAVLAFTQHPSQSLRQMVYSIWHLFLRHPLASKDPFFLAIIPSLIECGTNCLHKVGFPSQHNSVSCEYSRLEFDTDEEFSVMFCNMRMAVVDSTRLMTLMVPKLAFTVARSWLKDLLQKPIVIGAESDKGICNLSSPSFISWDACSVFLEAVMSKLFLAPPQSEMPNIQDGIDLLHSVLSYEMQDPLILSTLLSCISGLFPFLTYTPQTLPQVLAKIFGAVVFNMPGQTKSTRSQAVKNVRVHACSVLVKICKNYPNLLMPEFQNLYSSVKQLDSDPDQLSQMEKNILIEALIIVSNQFQNFSRQSLFIEEVIQPVKQLWSSEEFVRAFGSPDFFMNYVGLDQAAVEPSSADTCGINRSHIMYCLHTILAVIKRSKWPEDYSLAERGGFVMNVEKGNILRNPATPHVCPLLNNLIALVKTGCCLFKPENIALRHPDFVKAYDLYEHDRLAILGIPPPCVDNSDSFVYRHPLDRMQIFVGGVFEQSFHILGNASSCLGEEFYSTPGLSNVIIENLISNYRLLNEHRARYLLRNFVKLFIQHCPKEHYHDVAVPVLKIICPQSYERLVGCWQVINQRTEERLRNQDEEEDVDMQEILEDHLVRNLTKEYLDLLNLVLFGKGVSSNAKEETAMDDEEQEKSAPGITSFRDLSDLGNTVISLQEVYPSIVMCLLTGLSWTDTVVCRKSADMLWPICKKLAMDNKMTSEAAQHSFMSILSGLQLHGQFEACYSLLLHIALTFYETLRKDFPVLTSILQQIPNVNKASISELEEKLQPNVGPEKKKKDLFKKIVANIVGKNIGQQFRRTAQYSNLPHLFLESRRHMQRRLDEVVNDDLGLCALFTPVD